MRQLDLEPEFFSKNDPGRVNNFGFGRSIKKGAIMSDSVGVADGDEDLWFGHPRGLYICFMTEMWERFSYYGMRALLIFYLTQHFLFGDDKAFLIYGAYTALVYVTPMLGGILADRYLGARKAVTMGALLLVAGHFGMAFEGEKAEQFLTYQDQEMELVTEGRGKKAQRFLNVDGANYEIKFGGREWLELDGAPGGWLSKIDKRQVLEEGADAVSVYNFGKETYGFLWLKKRYFLNYEGQTYSVSYDADSESAGTFMVEGQSVHFDIKRQAYLTFPASGPAALPDELVADDYEIETRQNSFFRSLFYLSLALIISGVGFLKANISTIVGSLYPQNDVRRDGGFTIFYMGINLGAFGGALLAGWLGQNFGWGYGFGLAGIGMLGGLYIFLKGQPLLQGRAEPPDAERLKAPAFAGLSQEKLIWLGTAVGVLVIWQLIQYQELIGSLLNGFGALAILVVMIYSFTQCTPVERDRMLVATVLILSSIMFWALFEQTGSSLNLLADRSVDRVVLGYEIPASMFQSVNAAFIFMLAPLFNILWIKLAAAGREPSTPVKFGLGIIQLGLGFLVLVFGMGLAGDGSTALVWLMLIYLLHTTGELCLSPVGLSMVTKLSVGRVVGMMMGAWFLASGFANFVSARIAQMTSAETHGGEVVDAAAAAATYAEVYSNVGWMAIGVGLFMILISPLLRKGMHGVH
jgi:POT family proton-dependent oligopeptide transporter